MTTPVVSPPAPAQPPVSWVPTRKMITTVVTYLLTWGVALLVSHYGLHENSLEAGIVTAAIGIVAGGAAGYMVKEIPVLERHVKPAPAKM